MPNLPYPAPNVHLPRDGEGTIDLAKLKPSNVVLFFYPRDNTSGCTKEATGFSELLPAFEALNTKVPLLSDENDDICEKFDVWKEKSMYGKSYFGIERSTFLIDGTGNVVKEWRKVKVPGHVEDVLAAVKEL
ncbi:MAG: peroxiredoxin [Paracoccaceae bacterium]